MDNMVGITISGVNQILLSPSSERGKIKLMCCDGEDETKVANVDH
jgi:hypothetical protein